LETVRARDTLVKELGKVRDEMKFHLLGYVVMPEHVQLDERASAGNALDGAEVELVRHPRNWPLSSWAFYQGGSVGACGDRRGRVRRENHPKTHVQTTNLGHPPCWFELRVCESFLAPSKGV